MAKAVYKASDGSEYQTAAEAEHRDQLLKAAAAVRAAVKGLQRLLGAGARTADGKPFVEGQRYWTVEAFHGRPPALFEFWPMACNVSVDLDRAGGAVVVRAFHYDRGGGTYTTYPVSELYADRRKAEAALVQAAEEWLREKTADVVRLKAEHGPRVNGY